MSTLKVACLHATRQVMTVRCRYRQSLQDFETPAHRLLQLFQIVMVKATKILTFYFSIPLQEQVILPKMSTNYFLFE